MLLFFFFLVHKIHRPDLLFIRRQPANPRCCISITSLLSANLLLFETWTGLRRVPSESLVLSVLWESD